MSLFSKIYKHVWPQVSKFKLAFFSLVSIFGIRVLLEHVIKPLYLKKIIDTLSISGLDKISVSKDLYHYALFFIVISFVAIFLSRFGKFIYFYFDISMVRALRDYAFSKIQNNSQTFFANTFAGSLVTKSRRLIGSFETMLDVIVFTFWPTFIILIGTFIVLMRESKLIGGLFIGWIFLYSCIVLFLVSRKIKYDFIEAASDSTVSGRLADIFGNILAVKIFSARKSEINSFGEVTKDSAEKATKAAFFSGRIEVVQAVMSFLLQSVLLYIMINLWLQNVITTGTVVLVQTYMLTIFDKLWDLGNSMTKFAKAAADMKEVIDIFEIVPDILDPQKPEKLAMTEGNILFDNVSFNYKNGKEVFENFNLDIKKGERIGLVGHSGAGKSTIVALILRFMDIKSGSITIDGQDIRHVTQDDLRSAISYVPQESILFHRPIRENIAYGKQDATNEEIIEAAKKAHADEFISKLQFGYDTLVGERGVKLSGGERQRVAIARAMLKESPIIILDEATSSLDSISEHYIQEAFDKLMKGKTSIVIAHRLSTIQKMDRIIVLDGGKIVEEGTHRELLDKNGYYAELWNHQTGGFLED